MSIRICHVITGLGQGGAEMMLYNLLKNTDRNQFDPYVISLLPNGVLADPIRALNIPVDTLNMKQSIPSPTKIFDLKSKFKKRGVDIVQCWMYHANLLGGTAAKLQRIPVLWSVHHSNLERSLNKKTTLGVIYTCSKLSAYIPEKIIYCAEKARIAHEEIGYSPQKSIVIPNGFEISRFEASLPKRLSIREELLLSSESFVIGLVARFDPQKDHATFFNAANLLLERIKDSLDIHFVLCGTGITEDNPALLNLIPYNLLKSGRVHLLGPRTDMPAIYATLDIATLSSLGEGFPNVIGEAMACEVPCVVTDVGDAALLVGDTGVVVPIKSAPSLADGWRQLMEISGEERRLRGERARGRIEELFSIARITAQYTHVYQEVLKNY